ncbi:MULTISPECIES: SLC13 family permease [unclassified Cetobacterium]|uniref:SLC13 family permease n=1 Tax=unclassified Cetobacterium TaxID=2630983 RepID=UPI000646483A|nr:MULTISPECIES: SLC13 family permease [unclassified Cetobacterium]
MILSIVAFLMLVVMTICLLKNKTSPIVAFIIFPFIAVLGVVLFTDTFVSLGSKSYQVVEVVNWATNGVKLTMNNAILFMFSIIYFGIMNEKGLFDPIISFLVKYSGKNKILIYISTALIALVGQLDGATATTYLVTIPVMLPIYKKFKMNILSMLTIIGGITGVWNMIPWGGTVIRTSVVLQSFGVEVTPQELWKEVLPLQIVGSLVVIIFAIYFGNKEKRIESLKTVADEESQGSSNIYKINWLSWGKNFCLTVITILLMIRFSKIPSYFIFLIATGMALLLNFSDGKDQVRVIEKNAAVAFNTAGTFLAAGVFLGIFKESGMTKSLADILIYIFPTILLPQIGRVLGSLGSAIGIAFSSDLYYYSFVPVVIESVGNFRISPKNIALAMLIGQNVGTVINPCVPTTFLAIGLAGVELKDHIKFSLKYLLIISFVMVLFGIFLGIL